MKKIPTLFERDAYDRRYVTETVTPGCERVFGPGVLATRKWDGTCVMLDAAGWWFRREVKAGKTVQGEFIPVVTDPVTGKTFGWERPSSAGFDALLEEAIVNARGDLTMGTYELCGPKINGNPEGSSGHVLLPHGALILWECPSDAQGIRDFVSKMSGEGIVWWLDGEPIAKLKRRDLRPVTDKEEGE